ncbi:MAG: right-handed parallel beta-helix repeat-containing protein [Planctomycetaceae bacterium]|nr:right-handed parallel beta-helix repeat-containing protein [Planctomycetaceae bacterium]
MRALVGLWLVALVVPTLASARDIYVDNVNGDDRLGGHSPTAQGEAGGPCRSIAKALRIARNGDRVILANTGVPYRECVTIQGPRNSGDENYPLQIQGNGATLDGTMSLADARWEYFRGEMFRTRPARMSYQQLFVDDQPAVRKQPAAGQFPELGPRQWCLVAGWLYFGCDKNRLPQNYNLSCCLHPVGITLYNVHDVVVENLNIRGFYLDGVNCHDNVTRSDLLGLDCSYNGRSGISVGGASRVRIDTCTAAGNGAAQIRTEGFSITMLVDNKLDATSAPALVRESGKVAQEN